MKEKIKLFSRKYLIGFTIGAILFGSLGVYAATYFPSNQTTYDNTDSGMTSTNVQDALDELYTACVPPKGSDTITDLLPSNPDELYKDDHGDIRYYGAAPNNYVSFNNELWRIIGVIDGKIKIIRNESIDNNRIWASESRNNNWSKSDLKSYLNENYYRYSIDDLYKNMISEETYYLGGPTDSNYETLTASGYYREERSNNVYRGNPTSIKQYIGLMYPSDYGYAAGNNCLSTALYNYGNSCFNNDYLYTGVAEWLQTPYASANYNAALLVSGFVLPNATSNSNPSGARPVLYLNTNVQITGGTGTSSDPYTISM